MTVKQVEEILKGRFSSEEDRAYWEKKLAELKTKEATAKENEKYFRQMRRYDRL